MTTLITGIPHPFMNGAFRIKMTSSEAIEKALTYFKTRKVPFIWWIGSEDQSAEWGKHLQAHGLIYDQDYSGMAANLRTMSGDWPSPSGLTIESVSDNEMLKHWIDAALIGFGLPDNSEKACFDLFASLGFDLPLRNYVGLMDGKPVAASQLFLAAGVAGIYWVATVPEARRQGIGKALTLAPLREARAIGYRFSILHPTEIGLGVYRSLGFEDYGNLSLGIWLGES
jgi:ribosomal protein S18 acetylase RimI-like enzyme